MTEMDPLFKLLIERTRVLAVVCDNAAAVLSAEFESMILEPLVAVQEVLAQCPDVTAWDGTYREEDVTIDVFKHHAQRAVDPVSVKATHAPTGLSVESYSKTTVKENEAVARRALRDRALNRWDMQQSGQQVVAMGPRPSRAR